jgi:hypothetical protein
MSCKFQTLHEYHKRVNSYAHVHETGFDRRHRCTSDVVMFELSDGRQLW